MQTASRRIPDPESQGRREPKEENLSLFIYLFPPVERVWKCISAQLELYKSEFEMHSVFFFISLFLFVLFEAPGAVKRTPRLNFTVCESADLVNLTLNSSSRSVAPPCFY